MRTVGHVLRSAFGQQWPLFCACVIASALQEKTSSVTCSLARLGRYQSVESVTGNLALIRFGLACPRGGLSSISPTLEVGRGCVGVPSGIKLPKRMQNLEGLKKRAALRSTGSGGQEA